MKLVKNSFPTNILPLRSRGNLVTNQISLAEYDAFAHSLLETLELIMTMIIIWITTKDALTFMEMEFSYIFIE